MLPGQRFLFVVRLKGCKSTTFLRGELHVNRLVLPVYTERTGHSSNCRKAPREEAPNGVVALFFLLNRARISERGLCSDEWSHCTNLARHGPSSASGGDYGAIRTMGSQPE
jgi:hypothetical protein